jgi:hypothetical protein
MAEDVAATQQDVQTEETQETQVENAPDPKVLQAELDKVKTEKLTLERALTRQGHELGEQRKLIDKVLLTQVGQRKEEKADFFADPERAIDQKILSNPAIQALAQNAESLKQHTMVATLKAKHPDYVEVSKSDDFLKWVGDSKVRTDLFLRADKGYDFDCADELLSNWKERKAATKTAEIKTQAEQQNSEALKTAKVNTGNAGVAGKKTFSRMDLMRMKTSDPEKYNSLNVSQLYAEGRVK